MPGRLPDAIDEFAAAVRSDPGFVEAHLNLGNALAEAPGQLPEAIAEYETALRIRPDPKVVQMLERLRARWQ
jgi:protein O-mannosyl-transferase